MLKSLSWAAAIAAVLSLSNSASAGFTIFSDSFDAPNATQYETAPPATLPNWTVTSGNVDVVQGGTLWGPAHGAPSGQFLDLNGEIAGAISTDLDLAVGRYELSFAYRGNAENRGFSVSFGTLLDPDVVPLTGLAGESWSQVTYSFTVATAGTYALKFTSDVSGNSGAYIDDVSVAAVPEPTSMAIAGLGVAGLVGTRLRRRKAAAKAN